MREGGGARLLGLYNNSPAKVLKANLALSHSEEELLNVAGRKQGKSYWHSPERQREFLEEYARVRGIESVEDWDKKARSRSVAAAGGSGLLHRHNGSLSAALAENFPELQWERGRRGKRKAKGAWESMDEQRRTLDAIAEEWSVPEHRSSPEGWRRVPTEAVQQRCAGMLVRHEGLCQALNAVYGQAWEPFQCRTTVPAAYWQEEENVRKFVRFLAAKLDISEPGDWHRISKSTVVQESGTGLLSRMPLLAAASLAFEGVPRAAEPTSRPKKACQRLLRLRLAAIFAPPAPHCGASPAPSGAVGF